MAKFPEHKRIISVWAEHCSGPGWARWPVIVLYETKPKWAMVDGEQVIEPSEYRMEHIHVQDQTPEMLALNKVAIAVHEALLGAVRAAIHKQQEESERVQEDD